MESNDFPIMHGIELRPRVDPEQQGEVDPNLYPEPKDSTNKIRGRYDIIEKLFGNTDQELFIIKTFYFFFYSAFGSLFPLLGVYFKQIGLNPLQCGLLVGIRPFVEFISSSFWGRYADRSQKGKTLLIGALSAWIIFTLPVGLIQPPASGCLSRYNETHLMYNLGITSQTPHRITYVENFNKENHKTLVTPTFSSVVYRVEDIQRAFLLLFLLVAIGEFFSAPAITLADTAVLTILGDDVDKYGHQRMFGSLGWGLAMFFMGIALDNSTSFTAHPCTPLKLERNYTICFATFSILMGAALITATQIKYPTNVIFNINESNNLHQSFDAKDNELQNQIAVQLNLPSLAANTKVFAQTTTEMPDWLKILQQLKDIKCMSVLFVAWFMGFGIGLIFTFLFWHLQDFGGSPTLFGVASIINHVSEIIAYFFSFKLISEIGHVKVLCLGLIGNIIRFIYISFVKNAWWVLPFELMQGITHAAVWAACCSYVAHNTPPALRVLQGLHHGLGRGCGAVFGGILSNSIGTAATFRLYGISCLVVLLGFIFINFYRKDQGFVSEIPVSEDPHQLAEETSHLAPHGVPSNPIPKALSSSRLNELPQTDQQFYQQSTDGNLNVPNTANPFKSY
uniref:CSON014448 protein n=1 Tax=Culicoides sonorensis TaxID=179676 RepID=A0A336MMX4_CULSO